MRFQIKYIIFIAFLFAGLPLFARDYYMGPSISLKQMSASKSSTTTLNPALAVGYSDVFGKYYLAGELSATLFRVILSEHQDNGATNARTASNWALSLTPGIQFSEHHLGYLRVGFVDTYFQGPGKHAAGGLLGLGYETPLSGVWDLRMEYDYAVYHSMAGVGAPHSNEVVLGIIYRFNMDYKI